MQENVLRCATTRGPRAEAASTSHALAKSVSARLPSKGMMNPERPTRIAKHLMECASQMRTVTYEDVVEALKEEGFDEVGVAAGMGAPLGVIRERCRELNLPQLNVLVVNKGTRRPADDYLPGAAKKLGEAEREPFWRGMVMQVFCYPWENVAAQFEFSAKDVE